MAFHPYPRLIRRLFNAYRFGPPSTVTPTSAWTRVDHRVSRSAPPTKTPYSGSLSLRLTRLRRLTSPATLTRRLIMQKARRHPHKGAPTARRRTGSGSLSLPSRGAFHLSLTVLCAIGLPGVFSLAGWAPLIPTGFLVSCRTQGPGRPRRACRYGDVTLYVRGFPAAFPSAPLRARAPALLPRGGLDRPGLGCSPFARRYSGNRYFFLLLRVLGCFGSPRSPAFRRTRTSCAWVAPFGHPRIISRLPIPGEFRRSPRPSSPPEA